MSAKQPSYCGQAVSYFYMSGVYAMRILLLLIALFLSLGILFFAFYFLAGKLSKLCYTVLSSGISILLIFSLFHFIYLFLTKPSKK